MFKTSERGSLTAIDPRAALTGAIFISIIIAILDSPAACIAALAAAVVLFLLSNPDLPAAARRLRAANLFIFFIWLVTPWTTPGEYVLFTGAFAPTRQGLMLCVLVTLKANALLLIFMALITPMPLTRMATALGALHFPDKLAWMLVLMDRNVHFLGLEWKKLADAAKLRGFEPATSMHAYRTMASMLAILLIRAGDRGERMREAMLLRGFNGKLPLIRDFHFSRRDFYFACFILLLACGLIFLQAGF